MHNRSLYAVLLVIAAAIGCHKASVSNMSSSVSSGLSRGEAKTLLDKSVPTPPPASVQLNINVVTGIDNEGIYGPTMTAQRFALA